MSRDAKIIIFSLILIFSIYNKNVNGDFFSGDNNIPSTEKTTNKKKKKENVPKVKLPIYKSDDKSKGGKYKIGNNGYLNVNQEEVESFLSRFPKAENLNNSNFNYTVDVNYSDVKSYVFNENEIKNNSNWQRKIKTSLKTTLIDNRSFGYNLYFTNKIMEK